jgi:hypothetical protein
MRLFILLLFCGFLLSAKPCGNYGISREEKNEIKWYRKVFAQADRSKVYPRYTGDISADTIEGFSYIQYDSTRVYLDPEANSLNEIFTSGLLSAQLFFCIWDTSCLPPPNQERIDLKTGATLTSQNQYQGWKGNGAICHSIEPMPKIQINGTQRRFKLKMSRFAPIGIDVLFLELTNENANTETSMSSFIKGARVTYLQRVWSEI